MILRVHYHHYHHCHACLCLFRLYNLVCATSERITRSQPCLSIPLLYFDLILYTSSPKPLWNKVVYYDTNHVCIGLHSNTFTEIKLSIWTCWSWLLILIFNADLSWRSPVFDFSDFVLGQSQAKTAGRCDDKPKSGWKWSRPSRRIQILSSNRVH